MAAKVLLVDDDIEIRSNIRDALRSEHYEVDETGDGDEAVKLLNRRFDLVVTDFVHPGLDGLKLVEHIRSKWPTTPIVFMTAYISPNAAQALLCGGAEFISKPIDLAILLETIRRLLKAKILSSVLACLTIC
jgi:DNA-binding NtrC family response regulator